MRLPPARPTVLRPTGVTITLEKPVLLVNTREKVGYPFDRFRRWFAAVERRALRVGDCLLGYGQASLVVRQGKGGKQREVFIPQELKTHLKAFLTWKQGRGEEVSDHAPVFTGQRGPLTRNGVWRVVKGLMAAVGLDPRYATHTCRHTYATHLYRASGADLEIVQEQLGHASIKTTTIYAKVTKEDKARAADALAKAYRDSQQNRASGASWPRRRPGSPGVLPGSVASP